MTLLSSKMIIASKSDKWTCAGEETAFQSSRSKGCQKWCWNRIISKWKLTSMTMRPSGAPSAVTSKKTLGLDIFLELAVAFWCREGLVLTGFDLEVCSGRHLIGGVVRLLRLALTALWKEREVGVELPGVLTMEK